MNLHEYLEGYGRQASLSRATGLAASFINEMATGRKPVPIAHCANIERATDGLVTRKDLRPNDWHQIWPELADNAS